MTNKQAIKELAEQCLLIQDACNLSGVVYAWKTGLEEVLWPAARALGKGTKWVNQHPINVMFIDKLSSLAGCQYESGLYYSRILDQVHKIAETGEDYEA